MTEEREAKRIRQACQNCRHKKTRCSGEKPSCLLCLRLNQTCEYANGDGGVSSRSNDSEASKAHVVAVPNADLAARVALLESRLGLNGEDALLANPIGSVDIARPELDVQHSRSGSAFPPVLPVGATDLTRFSALPPLLVMRDLADCFFAECHNQPYCYFSERSFRRQLEDGTLPEYLLVSFVATAARYSTHGFFENRQTEAIETYARMAWHIILQQVFSCEQGLDLHAVQATNLLAIIDFTAGQHRLGWVKIGLAVRFAQGLRLNAEPDPMLPLWQQEERRRVFWSVYMLDRFVSCSRVRPPTILDADCTVRLPASELDFRTESQTEAPTISVLKDLPAIDRCQTLDDFALLVLMTSTLGRIVQFSLQQHMSKEFPPWDFRSDFAKASSILLSFESLLTTEENDIPEVLRERFQSHDTFDRQRVAHFVWSRGLYHLCCCLLYHPFLLHRYLCPSRQIFPYSFARECLRRGQDHAEQLTNILRTIQELRCCARGSFLGYFAVVASSVHQLYECSFNVDLQTRSMRLQQQCLDFLEQPPLAWTNYSRMSKAVREFTITQDAAKALIEPSTTNDCIDAAEMEVLSRVLDYGWLSDANRADVPLQPTAPMNTDLITWDPFNDFISGDVSLANNGYGGSDSTLSGPNPSNRQEEWWYHLSNWKGLQTQPPGFDI